MPAHIRECLVFMRQREVNKKRRMWQEEGPECRQSDGAMKHEGVTSVWKRIAEHLILFRWMDTDLIDEVKRAENIPHGGKHTEKYYGREFDAERPINHFSEARCHRGIQ